VRLFQSVDRFTGALPNGAVVALSLAGVAVVAAGDFLTGFEVSFFLFYLGPVALAAWYGGRRAGVAIAAISAASWFATDAATGHQYSHPVIPVWDALVRLGFFVLVGLLLTSVRNSLRNEQRLARIDPLTGLYSRRAFDERLGHDLALAQRRSAALTIAYLDLDHFKQLNDEHGHAEGDAVLRAVGQALSRSLREVDTAARLGGDEFAIVLPDTDSAEAQLVISKFRRALQEALGAKRRVSCSIGAITIRGEAVSPERAVAAADEQMYRAKRAGAGGAAFAFIAAPARTRSASRSETAID
jgi:diguanylate cyclase (GGDEF)-like protein